MISTSVIILFTLVLIIFGSSFITVFVSKIAIKREGTITKKKMVENSLRDYHHQTTLLLQHYHDKYQMKMSVRGYLIEMSNLTYNITNSTYSFNKRIKDFYKLQDTIKKFPDEDTKDVLHRDLEIVSLKSCIAELGNLSTNLIKSYNQEASEFDAYINSGLTKLASRVFSIKEVKPVEVNYLSDSVVSQGEGVRYIEQ